MIKKSMTSHAEQLDAIGHKVDDSVFEAACRVMRAGDRPLRSVFLSRALSALAELSQRLDEKALIRATGSSADIDVILRALEEPGSLILTKDDPLIKARLRGLQTRKQLLEAEGGMLTAPQVAEQLGISRQAVDKRRKAGKLLAIDVGRHGYLYPAWQLEQSGVLSGLENVLGALGTDNPWMRLAFFLTGDARLDGATPLTMLRQGEIDAVRRAARGYGEHAAA